MSWTLTYYPPVGAPVTKPTDETGWGLEGLNRQLESCAIDKFTFNAPRQAVDVDLLFAQWSQIVVKDSSGKTRFVGIVGKTPRRGKFSAESGSYEVWGPWYWLERLPFQQEWYSTDGVHIALITTTKSRVIIGQNIDGTKMDLGTMMRTVLNYVLTAAAAATPAFVPFKIGLMTPTMTIPFEEIKDMTCAQFIKHMLKFVPSCVQWFDYTTLDLLGNPLPTLNFAQRATLPNKCLPLFGGTIVSDWEINARYDLQIQGVIAKYEETNVIDSVSMEEVVVDKYPLTAPDNGFHNLVTTVDLIGGREAFQKQAVTVAERPIAWNDTIAKPWVLKKLHWLVDLGYDTDNIAINDITTIIHPDDPAATAPPTGFALDALTEELITGDITQWMTDNQDIFAATVIVKVTMPYLGSDASTKTLFTFDPTNPGVPTAPGFGYLVRYITIKATNASSTTYEQLTDVSASEPIPTGLAQAIYNELSVLHYEGFIETTEQECSGWIGIGNNFNTKDGRAEWQTMNAMVVSIKENIDKGITRVGMGPQRVLNLQDYTELLRAMRGILPSWHLQSRTNAQSAGPKIQGSVHSPITEISGPPSAVTTNSNPYAGFDASSGGTCAVGVRPGMHNGFQATGSPVTVSAGTGIIYVAVAFTYDALNNITVTGNVLTQSSSSSAPANSISSGSGGGSGTFYEPILSYTATVTAGKASVSISQLITSSRNFAVCSGAITQPWGAA